jgi:hypothetical protein
MKTHIWRLIEIFAVVIPAGFGGYFGLSWYIWLPIGLIAYMIFKFTERVLTVMARKARG